MFIEIKNRWTQSAIYSSDGTIKSVLLEAIKNGANLSRADLHGAALHGVDLSETNLHKAALYGSYLSGANLRGADFSGADLCGADLCRADLRGADLRRADFRGADLYGADLRDADLRDANLLGANLLGADFGDATLNWRSHWLIANILMDNADDSIARRKIAGMIALSTDWCWDEFLAIEDDEKSWVLSILARYVVDGDKAPKVLRDLASIVQKDVAKPE